jgi:hypothetical protein
MILKVVKMICVLAAAGVLGNWYLTEYRRVRTTNLPWYRAYLTVPAILIIILIFMLPLLASHI